MNLRLSSTFLMLCLLLGQTLQAQTIGGLLRTAQNRYYAGKYEDCIQSLSQAFARKPYHKKLLQTADMLIPGAFNEMENNIAAAESQQTQWLAQEKKLALQQAIIEMYTQLGNMAKRLQYIRSKHMLSSASQAFLNKDYLSLLQTAKEKGGKILVATAESFYQKAISLQKRGPNSFLEAIMIFEQSLQYLPDYKDAKLQIAGMYYQLAEQSAQRNDRYSFKQAALYFKACDQYVSGFRDAGERYEWARSKGTLRIAILPFENRSGKPFLGGMGEMQTDLILSSLLNDMGTTEFVEIITRDQLELILAEQQLSLSGFHDPQSAANMAKMLNIHHILTGKITQAIFSQPQTLYKTYREIKDIKVDEEGEYASPKEVIAMGLLDLALDSDESSQTKYYSQKAVADVVKYTKYASAKMACTYKLLDIETGRILKSGVFNHQDEFTSVWGTFTGNPYANYALSSRSQSLCAKSEAITPPLEELASNCAEQIAHNISDEIIKHLE